MQSPKLTLILKITSILFSDIRIRIQSGQWIRILNLNLNPDPGGQNDPK